VPASSAAASPEQAGREGSLLIPSLASSIAWSVVFNALLPRSVELARLQTPRVPPPTCVSHQVRSLLCTLASHPGLRFLFILKISPPPLLHLESHASPCHALLALQHFSPSSPSSLILVVYRFVVLYRLCFFFL
jgi:hypothetical protein